MDDLILPDDRKKPVNTWAFPSIKDGFIATGLCGLTILLTYVSTMAYPDTMPGPTWLVSLISFAPLVVACLMYRHCLSQMYIVTFVGFALSCALIGIGMGFKFWLGLIPGVIFWALASMSLHLWSIALPHDEDVDLQLMSRFTCMMGIVYYIIAMMFGNMVSIALEFFRAPFLLQPISIFGFATLEILVLFTNSALAWWVWAMIKTKKPFPLHLTRWFLNPLVSLGFVWVLWIAMAGIITAAHKPVGSVRVATVGVSSNSRWPDDVARAIAHRMRYQVESTGAKFVVAPEFALKGEPADSMYSCEKLITDYMNPIMAGSGAYYVVGCTRNRSGTMEECTSDNMAYTVSPDGKIIGVYGKEHPTPNEKSCTKTGPVLMKTDFPEKKSALGTDGPDNIVFSTVICYDADFTDSIAKAADLGAQLILNPAHDWDEVRHHYGTAVIRAVENRVAVVKAEWGFDPVIVDPFGKIIAGGTNQGVELAGEVSISKPLKQNWMRQNSPYWISIVVFAAFIGLDIYTIVKRRRQSHA